jgi:hypothetical protein
MWAESRVSGCCKRGVCEARVAQTPMADRITSAVPPRCHRNSRPLWIQRPDGVRAPISASETNDNATTAFSLRLMRSAAESSGDGYLQIRPDQQATFALHASSRAIERRRQSVAILESAGGAPRPTKSNDLALRGGGKSVRHAWLPTGRPARPGRGALRPAPLKGLCLPVFTGT